MHTGMGMLLQPRLRCALAPELRQSVTVLKMSAAELYDYVAEQERDNPLIEVEWPEAYRPGRFGQGYGDSPGGGSRRRTTGNSVADSEPGAGRRETPANKNIETLEMTLLAQLRMLEAPAAAKRAAAFLAGNLREDGYLAISPEEAAGCLALPLPDVETGLRLLQSLEPAGAAARTLEECLALQAVRDAAAPAILPRLIGRHLADVARRRWSAISAALGVGEDETLRAVRYLRSLNPRPGSAFVDEPIPYVIPEARLTRKADGRGCTIQGTAPLRIRLAPLQADPGASPAWKRWVAAKSREAGQLKQTLTFRTTAIRAVIAAVAECQLPFLAEGPGAIRPLKLEQIADRTGYHPSTVSRAANAKFVETPFGVVPLGRFFSSALETENGADVSSRAVKQRMRELIGGESRTHPLTDGQLAELLRADGVRISRRTVAKYREEERLLPSTMRRLPDS